MSGNYRTPASRAAKYDYLIKLLLIGDSGELIAEFASPDLDTQDRNIQPLTCKPVE
jgi:hypothetical protein